MEYNDRNVKRRAQSISEMLYSDEPSDTHSSRRDVHKSGYTGPKSVPRPTAASRQRTVTAPKKSMLDEDYDDYDYGNDAYAAQTKKVSSGGSVLMSGSLSDYIWIIYTAVLGICLILCMVIYSSGSGKKYVTYEDVPYVSGIVPAVHELATTGSSSFFGRITDNSDGSEEDEVLTTESITTDGTSVIATSNAPDKNSAITTTGAAMLLDSGNGMEGYTEATSHEELLKQLEGALASGDVDFVGMKIAYTNEYGDLSGYPQSVVDHFVKYMSSNGDKRSSFISQIQSEDYSKQNGDAYLVVIPEIKFTVKMGYDNSTISLPGFSDQVVNAGQEAEIKPLLPCMYTVTITNAVWPSPVTRDIEANIREVALSLNVK